MAEILWSLIVYILQLLPWSIRKNGCLGKSWELQDTPKEYILTI